ncbi:MAG TPA: glycosyltransferase family 39 protein [Bryobacteraceae bacterium]|nr:glycosyltransferase family 39 protein [Bryobacteraceae bacterium]
MRARLFPSAICALFLLSGLPFIPRLGLENDEALFAAALLPPRAEAYTLMIGHYRVPLMLLNYLGALKAWIYRPLIRAFGTGVWAIRLPMLLAGTASVWLFYRFLHRVAGERAAVIGSGLLAVDSMYLLSSCFDWGPVALQHLLVVGGLVWLMKFWQKRSEAALAGGFFLFGLALWDKALAVWILGGMGAAALVIVPREIRAVLTARRFGIAMLALGIGALPLVWYNVNTHGGTLQGTVNVENGGLKQKAQMLWLTVNGAGLYQFVPYEDSETEHPHAPDTAWERISAALAAVTRSPRSSLQAWAIGAALLLAALARGRDLRAILFAVIAMALAWVQMFFTAGTGSSVHHTILLWPLPQMMVGISFAAASRRLARRAVPVLGIGLAVMMGWGLAVTNAYYAQIARNGGAREWSDAIFPLSAYFSRTHAREIFFADWGMIDSVRLLNRGRLQLGLVGFPGDESAGRPVEPERLQKLIARPDNMFVTHTREFLFFPGVDDKLMRFAAERGYRRESVAVISDSYQRPTFEIYRFLPEALH